MEDMRPVVVLVDDWEGIRSALAWVFKDEYEYVSACDARQAADCARQFGSRVIAVLLDDWLGGSFGTSLIPVFRAHCHNASIIMIGALCTAEDLGKGRFVDADLILPKPWPIEALQAAVRARPRRQRDA